MAKNMGEAKNLKVAVLIPVHNGGDEVMAVLSGLKSHPVRVLVADDGSTDGTAERVGGAGWPVFRNGTRMGKGAALRRGIAEVIRLWPEVEWILFMDGDGQHLPGEVPRFLDAMTPEVDILRGSRLGEADKFPGYRLRANLWGSRVLYWISGQPVPDTQCGYRAIRTRLLLEIEIESSGFEVETEMLLKALRLGARWRSVPVSAVYEKDQGSHYRPIHDTFRLCMAGLRYAG
jgi:glycosyltransferase involved in cell wall biosynthesis